MIRAEVNQYFFIFGAIVVVLFLFAAYVSLEQLFDFTEPKRIVTLDSIEVLLESMDAQQGRYFSGYVTTESAVNYVESDLGRTISIGGSEGSTERQLVLRRSVTPSEFVIEGTARIDASVDNEAIEYHVIREPDCESEPLVILDLLDRSDVAVEAKRPDSLDDPRTIVVLAKSEDAYCDVIGLSSNYDVQAFVTPTTSRFTDREVFVVVV